MRIVHDFLQENLEVALATIGQDGRPKIRPFQIMKLSEKSIYFATSSRKEVYNQIISNPNIEIMSMRGSISVRVVGRIYLDVRPDVGRQIYESTPILKRLYSKYDDLMYMRMKIESSDYIDISTTPITHQHYAIQ